MRRLSALSCIWLAGAVLAGCGGSNIMRAADAGDVDALRNSIGQRGDLDVGDAQDIARRFMSQQITTAQGPSGRRGLESLECAALFDDSLERRSSHDDELAAWAAIMRIEAGKVAPMTYMHHLSSKHPHWRAVAARSLSVAAPRPATRGDQQPEELVKAGVWRRKLMLDPSTEVRVAALRAAYDAADPADVAAVLETSRLDPDSEVRLVAIQAVGKIGTREGVVGLMDLWANADEEARLAIVGAWAASSRKRRDLGDQVGCELAADQSASCEAWHRLQRISDMGDGMPSLVASLELVHDVTPAQAGTPEGNAAAVVERMIDDESTRIRVEAIASAPLSWAHLVEAIIDASGDSDPLVVVAALARETELGGDERKAAIEQLRTIAKKSSLDAERARTQLANVGDPQVVPLLAVDAKAASAEQRASAAARYASLGQVTAALRLLADKDPRVRSRAACAILQMSD